MQVEVDVIRKTIYEFTVEPVLDEYGKVDKHATSIKVAELYEQALEDGTLQDHYFDEDYDYEMGDTYD